VEEATTLTITTATSRKHTLPGMKIECRRSGRGENTLCWFEITNAKELAERDKQIQMELPEDLPVTKRRLYPIRIPGADAPEPELAARCQQALKSIPKADRDKMIAQIREWNLPAKVTDTTPGSVVKSFASALRKVGIELPPQE